jgi:hypothetical protein
MSSTFGASFRPKVTWISRDSSPKWVPLLWGAFIRSWR